MTVRLSCPTPAVIAVAVICAGLGRLAEPSPAWATAPAISVSDFHVIEGDSGTTDTTFAVSLSEPSAQPVTVEFATADGTAAQKSDYEARSGRLTFAPGEAATTVAVPVHGDTTDELDETFSLNLSNPTNGYIADGQGIATILNQDPPPQGVGPIIRLTRAYRVTRGYALPLRLSCTAGDRPLQGSGDRSGPRRSPRKPEVLHLGRRQGHGEAKALAERSKHARTSQSPPSSGARKRPGLRRPNGKGNENRDASKAARGPSLHRLTRGPSARHRRRRPAVAADGSQPRRREIRMRFLTASPASRIRWEGR